MPRSRFPRMVAAAWLAASVLVAIPAAGAQLHVVRDSAQGIEAVFTERTLRLSPLAPGAWTLELALDATHAAVGSFVESREEGLVHGIEIVDSPEDGLPPSIPIALAGSLVPKLRDGGPALDLYAEGIVVLRYEVLGATDARGAAVPAHLEMTGDGALSIVLERAGAYPIKIETSFASPKGARARRGDEPVEGSPQPEAAPANDTCGGAVTIPAAGPFPYTTPAADITDATTTGDPVARPPCAFPTDPVTRSVWYQITPAQSGTYRFSTCHGASTCLGDSGTTVDDPVMAVYTSLAGCIGPFLQLPGACDDDGCDLQPFQSYLEAALVAGTTYYVVVWNVGPAPAVGQTSLRLLVDRPGTAPPNDTCAGGTAPGYTIPPVIPLPAGYLTPVTGDITDATSAGDPLLAPSCLTAGFAATRSTWYTFTPAATAVYRISSCASDAPGSTVDDTLVAVYTSVTGCLGPFVEVPTLGATDGCDDDGCGVENLQGVISTQLTAGTTYSIVVYKVGTAPPGCDAAVQLFVTRIVPPANDRCAGAPAVALDTPVSGSTEQASDDYRAPATFACFTGVGQVVPTSTGGADVVYRFTAPSTDVYSFRVTGYATSRNLVLYLADCPQGASPQTAACIEGANRNSSSPGEEIPCLPLSAGKTVWIYVDDTGETGGSPYTLEVNRCHEGTEPGSTPVVCGIEGSIQQVGDVDFYELATPPALSRVFSLVDGVAANSSDFDLRVTTDVDTLEYDDLDADLPFGALSGTCDGTPLTGVVSYLRVSLFGGSQVSEPYRLYSVLEPAIASAVAETEPNDTAAQANTSPLGYFSGALATPSPSTDADWYAFDAAAGALIFVALDGDPLRNGTPLNASLGLYDGGSGALLVTVDDGDGSSNTTAGTGRTDLTTPRSPGEALTWRARTTGTYHVKVAAGQQASTPRAGDYLLAISTGCVPRTDDPDGDGAATASDCAPANPGAFAIPGEATSVTLGPGTSTISWVPSEGGSGNLHDLLRGSIGALPVGPGGADETCFPGLAGASTSDTTNPLAGQGYWYLVRGVNVCGAGVYGTEGRNGAAGPARTSTTCP